MEEEYMCLDVEKKKEYVSRKAKQFLQSQAPCSNMNKKKKWLVTIPIIQL